jgi:predicted amidophosphoribosyltransferase
MSKTRDLFVCPVCKMKNEETRKYCAGCGTWLLSETFPAEKHKVNNNIDRLYICAFCDTANEPNRNACKKCFKPLFSTEYETKEIKTTRKNKSKWLKVIYLSTGIPIGLFALLLALFANGDKNIFTWQPILIIQRAWNRYHAHHCSGTPCFG